MIIKKVLLASDFSEASLQLIDRISEFKPLGLEEVILVHVVDVGIPMTTVNVFQTYDEEILKKQKESIEVLDLKVTVMVPLGFPASEIVRIAEEEKVSLITIASHGKGIIQRLFLGSTTTDVIRTSTVPVLVEKRSSVDKDSLVMKKSLFKKVLLPIDFSEYSQRVLDEIKDLPQLVEELILISVIEKAYNDQELQKAMTKNEARLNQIKQDFEGLGFRTRIMIYQGSASTSIIDVAEEEDVSLIVMATRGEGLIKELLLGSTAHAVARRSSKPLLLIPLSRIQ
ncbi:MAG TPA: universal stress protein [Syntrophomonadaceae bacterium]|nr:universal stress protein [Syntrophomonadaceae bacterium]